MYTEKLHLLSAAGRAYGGRLSRWYRDRPNCFKDPVSEDSESPLALPDFSDILDEGDLDTRVEDSVD